MSGRTFPAAFMAQPSRIDRHGWYVETKIHAVEPFKAIWRAAVPVTAVAVCGREGEITTSYDPAKLAGLAARPSLYGFCGHCARKLGEAR